MSDFEIDDHGHDGGYDGGYDAGHQDASLDHLHAEQGHEHDQLTNYDQYSEDHAQEADVHYANLHEVHAGDGHGAYYSSVDATEYDAHEASADSVNAESYTNAEHDSNFAELDHLRERLESDFIHDDGHGRELHEGGHDELTAR